MRLADMRVKIFDIQQAAERELELAEHGDDELAQVLRQTIGQLKAAQTWLKKGEAIK